MIGTNVDVIKIIKDFANLLNSAENEWDDIYKMIGEIDDEMQDLLHEAELTVFNAAEGYDLAKKIQEVRQRRRELKNRREILRFVKDFIDNNKKLTITLFKMAQNMENSRQMQEKREYTPRIRTDIKLAKRWDQSNGIGVIA